MDKQAAERHAEISAAFQKAVAERSPVDLSKMPRRMSTNVQDHRASAPNQNSNGHDHMMAGLSMIAGSIALGPVLGAAVASMGALVFQNGLTAAHSTRSAQKFTAPNPLFGVKVLGHNQQGDQRSGPQPELAKQPLHPVRVGSGVVGGASTAAVLARLLPAVTATTSLGAKVVLRGTPIGAGIAAGVGAYQGVVEDGIRGAGRGVVKSMDPSAFFMPHGYGEQAFNAAFGAPGPRLPHTLRERAGAFLSDAARRVDGIVHPSARPPAGAQPLMVMPPAYKDNWIDNRGVSYTRRNFAVRKAS